MGREGLWALVGHIHPEWSSSTDLLENCRTRVNLDLSKKRQSLMHAQKMEEPMYVCDQAERRKQTKSNMASASKKREPSSKTRLKSSRRASSPAPTKNPWDGYDWDNMPTITPEQRRTFRGVTQEELDRFRCARGRPKKEALEKTQPITLRIEPALLR